VEGKDRFVRDFALVFSGIPSQGNWKDAAMQVRYGPKMQYLHESNDGLPESYLDSLEPQANQSHHFAGNFYLGYFAGYTQAGFVNLARDFDNPGDINLGAAAALAGAFFRYGFDDALSIAIEVLGGS
jgi:hypothetical protein